MLLYIHGFNSSSASFKARQLQQSLRQNGQGVHFAAPDLPHFPRQAIQLLQGLIESRPQPHTVKLVGSSLGGYYATWLAERYDCKAVLVNPALRPYELLRPLLGEQQNLYTGERYVLTLRHLAELEHLEVARPTRPERYFLLVQTGDEVLDYRAAVARYAGARQRVIEGGDHGFRNFAETIPEILDF